MGQIKNIKLHIVTDIKRLRMNCLPPRKNKRKRKRNEDIELTKVSSGKWKSVDIDTDLVFSNGASVDGFLGLEELNDYDEDAIRSLSDTHRKKKKKKKNEEEDVEEEARSEDKIITLKNPNFKSVIEEINTLNSEDAGEKTQAEDRSISGSVESVTSKDTTVDENGLNKVFIKKPSKKERRKDARKQSFKMKLKERRKKLKEMKRASKQGEEGEEEEVEAMAQVNINEMCETVLKASESFDMRANVRKTMGDWLGLGVPDEVLQALADCKFTTPTQIQKETLPQAILCRKDVIGAAETGSGKTLAFGIPLLKIILDMKSRTAPKQDENNDPEEETPMYALIISPTRELAMQITQHIQTAAKYTTIQCVTIVGGLAAAKQERLLTKCPEIVVGTPGRLHKLMTDGCEHLNKINTLKLLVIDEADRMLEQGHFKELNDILDIINRVQVKRQIFVFSATLTLPQHHKNFKHKNKKNIESGNTEETQMLMDKVGLNAKAEVIDLTPKHVTATQLEQLRVLCTEEEKIIYLVYFLLHHPGRSVIFVNSIALTRRLCSLLSLLNFTPLPLHAGKQQRQRIKYLERFTENENGLLIATDVAARGLDIPNVCNVVHFQLPKDPKVYIHRSGRTARAQTSGISLILQGPEDFPALKKVTNVLKLGKDIPCLNVDRKVIDGIKTRVALAKEIDQEEHKHRKENANATWIRKSAAAMEMEADEIEENFLTKSEKARLNAKRKQLENLLSQELRPSGYSGSYITQSGSLLRTGLKMSKR